MFKIGDRVRIISEDNLSCGKVGIIRSVYTSGLDIVADIDVDLVSRKIIYYEISIDDLEMVNSVNSDKEDNLSSKLHELSELDIEIEAMQNTIESCTEDRMKLIEEIQKLTPNGYKFVEETYEVTDGLIGKYVICYEEVTSDGNFPSPGEKHKIVNNIGNEVEIETDEQYSNIMLYLDDDGFYRRGGLRFGKYEIC